jgi:Phage portal protein
MSRRSTPRRQRAAQAPVAPVAAATGWSGSEQQYGIQLSAEAGYVRGASPISGPVGKTSSKQLRRWSRSNPWIRSAVNLRRTQVSRSTWDILPLDDDSPAVPDAVRLACRALFLDPNPKERSFRAFIEPVVEDLLVLDQGAVEQEVSVGYAAGVKGGKSPVVHLWGIDGATIRVDPDWDGSDEKANRYFQFAPDGTPGAMFTNDELTLIIANPVTYYPLGLSALEVLADTIEADIRSAEYASRIVSNASPPGIIDLGHGVRADQVDAFRAYWDAEIAGRSQIAITGGGENMKWVSLAQSAKEMQFMEWQEYLARKICAVFGCQPQDIGITADVNRSQGDVGQESTSDHGILPLLSLIAEYLTGEVVRKFSPFLRFAFTDIGRESQMQASAYYTQAMHGIGFIRPNNALRERGEEPLEEYGDEVWVTTNAGPVPMSLYLKALTAPPPPPPTIMVAPPGQAPTGEEGGATPGEATPTTSAPGEKPPASGESPTASTDATSPAEGATGKAVGAPARVPFSVLAFYRRPAGARSSTGTLPG